MKLHYNDGRYSIEFQIAVHRVNGIFIAMVHGAEHMQASDGDIVRAVKRLEKKVLTAFHRVLKVGVQDLPEETWRD